MMNHCTHTYSCFRVSHPISAPYTLAAITDVVKVLEHACTHVFGTNVIVQMYVQELASWLLSLPKNCHAGEVQAGSNTLSLV